MCIKYLNENDSLKINNSLYLNEGKKFINEDDNFDYTYNE